MKKVRLIVALAVLFMIGNNARGDESVAVAPPPSTVAPTEQPPPTPPAAPVVVTPPAAEASRPPTAPLPSRQNLVKAKYYNVGPVGQVIFPVKIDGGVALSADYSLGVYFSHFIKNSGCPGYSSWLFFIKTSIAGPFAGNSPVGILSAAGFLRVFAGKGAIFGAGVAHRWVPGEGYQGVGTHLGALFLAPGYLINGKSRFALPTGVMFNITPGQVSAVPVAAFTSIEFQMF